MLNNGIKANHKVIVFLYYISKILDFIRFFILSLNFTRSFIFNSSEIEEDPRTRNKETVDQSGNFYVIR